MAFAGGRISGRCRLHGACYALHEGRVLCLNEKIGESRACQDSDGPSSHTSRSLEIAGPFQWQIATKSSCMPLPAFSGGYTEPKGRPMVIAVTGRLGSNELLIAGSKDDANGYVHRQRGVLSMFGGSPVLIMPISTGIQVRELLQGRAEISVDVPPRRTLQLCTPAFHK